MGNDSAAEQDGGGEAGDDVEAGAAAARFVLCAGLFDGYEVGVSPGPQFVEGCLHGGDELVEFVG